jgi:hypothetical protein
MTPLLSKLRVSFPMYLNSIPSDHGLGYAVMNIGGAETNARDIVKWAPRSHSLALYCSQNSA